MNDIAPADLACFLAIARHGSFRRGAQNLKVTPSALSHALRTLEERIDVRLFNRTTRSVALTEAGKKLFDAIEPSFRTIEQAIDSLDAFRAEPMGTLRINAAESAARLVLLPIVGEFLRLHPGVTLEIITQGALVDVVAQGYDAGIRFGETLAADMIAVPIGPRQRFVAVASPDFLSRHSAPREPADLLGLPCIRFRFDNGADYHWEFERAGTELALAVDGPLASNSQDVMIRAALDGVGVAFVFEDFARDHIRTGRLVALLEDWTPDYPGLFLYYPGRRQIPSALRAFIDFTRQER